MDYVTDPNGMPGPFGLTQYTFRDNSGYRGEDLFVGHRGQQIVRHALLALQCQTCRARAACATSGSATSVAMTYRFKRANLAQWQDIARGTDALITGFEARAK